MQDRLYNLLIEKDEITWQSIVYDLIKTEQMNPWDIDISLLSQKYLETVKKMQEMNFFISGKVLLASALLLRIKSDKLIAEDVANLDAFLFGKEEENTESFEEYSDNPEINIPSLAIKTPQARKRKVSVKELINALQKALDLSKKKEIRKLEEKNLKLTIPEKKVDITKLIKDIYERVMDFFKEKEVVTFSELIMSDRKEDKISIFIPLLHLDNQGKINLQQKEHFGEIEIVK